MTIEASRWDDLDIALYRVWLLEGYELRDDNAYTYGLTLARSEPADLSVPAVNPKLISHYAGVIADLFYYEYGWKPGLLNWQVRHELVYPFSDE